MKQIRILFRFIVGVSLLFLTMAHGATVYNQFGVAQGYTVQKTTLAKGKDFELKNFTYVDKRGNNQSIDLFIVGSAIGAENAYQLAGMSFTLKNKLIQEFNLKKSNEDYIIIIDKELSEAHSKSEIETILKRRGLSSSEIKALIKQSSQKQNSYKSYRSSSKTWRLSFDKRIDIDENWGGINPDLEVDIDTQLQGEASATLNYKTRYFLGIPIWVKVKKLILQTNYTITGDIGIQGTGSHTAQGRVWHIAEPTIAQGLFFVFFIPISYDITLPITAGTGDLNLRVKGNIDLDSSLNIHGDYGVSCTRSSCSKDYTHYISSSDMSISNNTSYASMASAKLEPYAKVAIKGSIYRGFLQAEAGVKSSLPIALNSYCGNTCGDGDGIHGNENVNVGIVNVDFRLGIEAKAGFWWRWQWHHYWQIYRTDLFFEDLISPYSTGFSPIIRPTSNLLRVSMPVSLRPCIASIADRSYQDFTIHWGDGAITFINNLNDTLTFNHTYTTPGTYTISVVHTSGAKTSKKIRVSNTIGVPKINHISAHAIEFRENIYWNAYINATNSPTEYAVYKGNTQIASSSNPFLSGSIKGFCNDYFIRLKARARNSSGWSPFKEFTIFCHPWHPYPHPPLEDKL